MIKNGLFTIAIGFVVVILGLTDFEERRILILGIGILLIILGFTLYNKGEKKSD
ncbi:DUF3188 domain-containing protein [Carnobacterium sp. ISL-102]|uniref:DUF3188 domain-containing protein n=1 Tax=Carnobacterium sp. ISL-102 TaxID=2819142 RepID=UPI001BEC35A4|nr:DUF3188 domain-containing protein [Carnobacterium sp. ISL-102]MBT2731124.1 DUF3188 domain-containing protein [Carnobacterium sp. ISL-102]